MSVRVVEVDATPISAAVRSRLAERNLRAGQIVVCILLFIAFVGSITARGRFEPTDILFAIAIAIFAAFSSYYSEEAKLIAIARQVNDSKPLWIVEKIKQSIAEYLHENQEKTSKDVTIACFGLTFKPDIDDLRESPALAIVEHLMVIHKGPILVVEPHITKLPAHLSEIISLANHELVLKEANIIVMLVNHKVFHGLPKLVDEHFKIIDVRGK